MSNATLKEVMEYFNMTSSEFRKEWPKMTDQDKAQIKAGLGNGTLTY